MMNEVLDKIDVKNGQKRFSIHSLVTSLINLGLLTYLFSSIPRTIKVSEGVPEPPMILVIATQLLCLAGMVFMILSFTKKEPTNWFKWVGAILNVILFLVIIGSIVLARVL